MNDRPVRARAARAPWSLLCLLSLTGCGGEAMVEAQAAERPAAARAPAREHARRLEVTFTPSSHGGKMVAFASLGFTHTGGGDGAVLGAIHDRWDRMQDRVVDLLLRRGADELVDPRGIARLEDDLRRDMSAILFPDGAARVDGIVWHDLRVH